MSEPDQRAKETQRVAALEADAKQLREWLAAHPTDRQGPTGGVRKSNLTDNESAKMATGKGVLQGFTGVAAVDAAHQIIVEAQAFGTGVEQECLLPVVTALAPLRTAATLITADAGYHGEANLAALAGRAIAALIADGRMRARDDRFATQHRHQQAPNPLHDKRRLDPPPTTFGPRDFRTGGTGALLFCLVQNIEKLAHHRSAA